MIFDFAALFSTDRQNYFIFKTTLSEINYDLSIVKESLNKTVNQGQNVIFNIIVKNNGTVMLDNVFIKEANFDDLIFTNWQKIKGDWEYNQVNGKPFFKLLNFLGVNQTASIQVEFKTTNPGLKVNFAVTGYNDTNITNTTNNTTVKPKEVPSTTVDLYINKTVNNTNPLYYDYLTYTITVVNKNPEIIAKNVKVNEILPDGLTYIWDDSNGNYDPITGVWLIGDLTDNPATLQLKVITTKIGNITNYVNVTTSNKETNYTNNNDTVTVIVNSTIDLLSNKTVNNTSPNYLDEITWTVTISNYGICNATGVKAFEYLPEGLVYISSTVSKGFYNSTNNVWTIDDLGINESVTLTLINKSNIKIMNLVNVTGLEHDTNITNNPSNQTINIPPSVDLRVYKTVNNTNPHIGEKITWNVTVMNNGLDNATGVKVFEYLPESLVYISSTVSKGFYNSTNNVWIIGDLSLGEIVDLTLITYVKVGNLTLTNNVYVTGNEYDWNITNNYGNKTILINSTLPSKENNTENKTINITNTTITPNPTNNNTNISVMKKTKIPYKNTTANNSISNKNFNMKNTGNPIITLLLVLFALILIISYKHKKK